MQSYGILSQLSQVCDSQVLHALVWQYTQKILSPTQR